MIPPQNVTIGTRRSLPGRPLLIWAYTNTPGAEPVCIVLPPNCILIEPRDGETLTDQLARIANGDEP